MDKRNIAIASLAGACAVLLAVVLAMPKQAKDGALGMIHVIQEDFVQGIKVNGTQVINNSGQWTGAVNGTTGTFSGAVSGTTGTFTGAVSGTTLTGTGVIEADGTSNSVSTVKVVTANGTLTLQATTIDLEGVTSVSSTNGTLTITAGDVSFSGTLEVEGAAGVSSSRIFAATGRLASYASNTVSSTLILPKCLEVTEGDTDDPSWGTVTWQVATSISPYWQRFASKPAYCP